MKTSSLKKKAFVAASIAGLMMAGAAIVSPPASADDVACYGVNKCKGTGACAGATGCAGKNACKGAGVMMVASKDACLGMTGGSLTQVKK